MSQSRLGFSIVAIY